MAEWTLPTYKDIEAFPWFEGKFKLPKLFGEDKPLSEAELGDIISALLPYLFTLAGLGLFLYLIIAGFGWMTSGGDPKKTQSAKDKLTNALVGFIIIFVAYWLILILEKIFGLDIF